MDKEEKIVYNKVFSLDDVTEDVIYSEITVTKESTVDIDDQKVHVTETTTASEDQFGKTIVTEKIEINTLFDHDDDRTMMLKQEEQMYLFDQKDVSNKSIEIEPTKEKKSPLIVIIVILLWIAYIVLATLVINTIVNHPE